MLKIYLYMTIIISIFGLSLGANAQNFNAAYRVNSAVITHYEIEQMQSLLEALGENPATSYKEAVDFLIHHRLLKVETQKFGFDVDENTIMNTLRNMAPDGDVDQFIANLGERGISRSTLDIYVEAQILRRSYAQFRGLTTRESHERVAQVINNIPDNVAESISISEIVLPYGEYGGRIPARLQYKIIRNRLNQGESFAALARQFSRAPTGPSGGQIPDIPLEGLNPELQSQVDGLAPGQITPPIETEGAIIIIRLNGYGEIRNSLPRTATLTYVDIFIGGNPDNTKAQARSIMSNIQSCGHAEAVLDKYSGSKKIENKKLSELSTGVSLALSRMETGTQALFERENGTSILYLCERKIEVPEDIQEVIDNRAKGKVVEDQLDGVLRDLRASASIVKVD